MRAGLHWDEIVACAVMVVVHAGPRSAGASGDHGRAPLVGTQAGAVQRGLISGVRGMLTTARFQLCFRCRIIEGAGVGAFRGTDAFRPLLPGMP